jgi:hypothetical protein
MDIETRIAQLEPIAPDAPGGMTYDGPAGLAVRAEVNWFEGVRRITRAAA